jgi:photosystem II stability/assembly factor-like uncharacterized protein
MTVERRVMLLLSAVLAIGCGRGPDAARGKMTTGPAARVDASTGSDADVLAASPPAEPACAEFTDRSGQPGWFSLGLLRSIAEWEPHPANGNLVFAISAAGAGDQPHATSSMCPECSPAGRRLWRSGDGGRRFCLVDLAADIQFVLPATGNAQVVYVLGNRAGQSVFFRSHDGGLTWADRAAPGVSGVVRLYVDPRSADTVMAVGMEATNFSKASPVRRTVDGGKNWTVAGPDLPEMGQFYAARLDLGNPDQLYLNGYFDSGAVRGSTRLGLPTLVRLVISQNAWQIVHRASAFSDFMNLEAVDLRSRLYRRDVDGRGYLRSDDGGLTWSAIDGQGLRALQAEPLPPGDLFALSVAGASRSLVRSSDGGRVWTTLASHPIDDSAGASWIRLASTKPRTFLMLAGLTFSISTDDGSTWEPVFSDTGRASSVVIAPSTPPVVYLSAFGGLLRSEDGGLKWTPRRLPGRLLAIRASSPHELFAGSSGHGLNRSDDGGRTWKQVARFPASALAVTSKMPDLLHAATSNGVVFRSDDGGASWREMPRIDWAVEDKDIVAMATAESAPAVSYLLESAGELATTTDGWRTSTIRRAPAQTATITVHPTAPATLLALGERVWRSTNGGEAWTDLSSTLPATGPYVKLSFDPRMPATLYLLTAASPPWRSDDGGTTWRPLSRGFPPGTGVLDMAIDTSSAGTYIVLAERGLGPFKTTSGGE